MASYMALTQGWVDAEGKVEPIQFEGERMFSVFTSFAGADRSFPSA